MRQFFDGPIVLSGAIADGGAILAAQAIGADLAYIGTRFIATEEANAATRYKEAMIEQRRATTSSTPNLFSGVHGNYLGTAIAAPASIPTTCRVADKSKMNFGTGGNSKTKAWRDIWGAGQGVGQIDDAPPVAELVARLKCEFDAASGDFLQRALAADPAITAAAI